MKSASTTLKNAIRRDYNLYCLPRLTAEWNMNNYTVTTADNIPTEGLSGYDTEMFPIESIYQPNRPTRGINKARIGEARIAEGYESAPGTRYYVADVDDQYKYWTSPVESSGATFPTHSDGRSIVRPHINYNMVRAVNKIVIKLENSWASPASYQVITKTSTAGSWNYASPAATNPVIDGEGKIVLYWNGAAWSTTKPSTLTATTNIAGVMLMVNTMNRVNSYFSLIEISARREVDLTDRLISVDDTMDLGEYSNIYPMGTITSNTGTLTFFNGDGIFDQENAASPYFGILEPNVVFNLEYVYTIGGTKYAVQQFNMYGGPWEGQKADEVTVELTDYSKFWQDAKPRPTMYQNISASEVVWRLCDQVGFTNYVITNDDFLAQPRIPIFWTNGEETIWEIFDEISKATQTAIYFDSWGRLQVRSRNAAFQSARTPDWTLRGRTSGLELADIEEMNQSGELDANFINVIYQTTEFSDYNKGFPILERVWEPEGTMVLRAAPIANTLGLNDNFVHIPQNEAEHWPYFGLFQIQGEIVRYEGKGYSFVSNGVRTTRTVKSQEEKDKLDEKTPASQRWQNHFTGTLAITQRGVWNSENKRHPVEAEGYSVRNVVGGSRNTSSNGFTHIKAKSQVNLWSTTNMDSPDDILLATRGSEVDSGFWYYGTRLKFNGSQGRTAQQAGIVIHNNGASEQGYFIELMPTRFVDRTFRDELIVYSKVGTARHKQKSVPLRILQDVFYDIDVRFSIEGADHVVTVWVNGVNCGSARFSSNKHTRNGKFGMFVRDSSNATFEYLYAINRDENPRLDGSTIYDRTRGAYTSAQWEREWVYRWRDLPRRIKKNTEREKGRWNAMFFDEFGPYIHEVREFDVKFDPAPVLHSRLFFTNDWAAVCTEYKSDAFGAKFIMANTSRYNAVIHGEDRILYAGTDKSVNQITLVFGRAVIIRESEVITAKNDLQISKRGKIEAEITSRWIQTKSAAEKLAEWIKNHWSEGADQQEVTIFGNPLFEIGDVVTVEHPERNMTAATHKYFVVAVRTDFADGGLGTTLTLRRVV